MIDVMKRALKVLENKKLRMDEHLIPIVVDDLRQAIEQAEKEATLQEISDIGQEIEQEPFAVAWALNGELFWPFEYEVIAQEGDGAQPLYAASLKQKIEQAHTDHPARHWDRTCPACVEEAEQPVSRLYSIEPHGNGYAIYCGRDWQHHGANIGHLTEVTPATIKLIQDALNATLAQPDEIKSAVLAEREACAKAVYDSTDWAHEEQDMTLKETIAAAIRARGDKHD